MTQQLPLAWPDPRSNVARLVERLASIPPPPASQTRIRLGMVRGEGDRNEECRHYDSCIDYAAKRDGEWHCPTGCASRDDVTRFERLAEAIAGRCRSSLADFDDTERIPPKRYLRNGMQSMADKIVAALADGSRTTIEIATATGYERTTLSSRMVDFERAGIIRRVGWERLSPNNGKVCGRVMRWEVVK